MTPLPRSAQWVSWFNAWTRGYVPVDDAVTAVRGDDAAHDVIGLGTQPVPLFDAWVELRSRGATTLSLALPVPGDPLGLTGPPELNEAAIEAGEAVLAGELGIGFVPSVIGSGVFWHGYPANPSGESASVGEAERRLREQLIATADELTALDIARWRPEVAEALSELREASDDLLPPGYDQRARRCLTLAARCLRIEELARGDDGNAVTASEVTVRARSLDELVRAARAAVVAACTLRPSR